MVDLKTTVNVYLGFEGGFYGVVMYHPKSDHRKYIWGLGNEVAAVTAVLAEIKKSCQINFWVQELFKPEQLTAVKTAAHGVNHKVTFNGFVGLNHFKWAVEAHDLAKMAASNYETGHENDPGCPCGMCKKVFGAPKKFFEDIKYADDDEKIRSSEQN